MDYIVKRITKNFSEAIISNELAESIVWYERQCGDIACVCSFTDEEKRYYKIYKSRLFKGINVICGEDIIRHCEKYGVHDNRLQRLLPKISRKKFYNIICCKRGKIYYYKTLPYGYKFILETIAYQDGLKNYIAEHVNDDIMNMDTNEIDCL